MDKIDRMRKDILKLKVNTETQGALNLMMDLFEEYRDNEFVQRIVNHYVKHECSKEQSDEDTSALRELFPDECSRG